MPTPREQAGGLNEASRLLQEGLALLDERSRELDALVREAQERAREIVHDANAEAQRITAEAEQQKAELEEQVAALRTELASIRAGLAAVRKESPPVPATALTRNAREADADAAAAEEATARPLELVDPADAAELVEAAEAAGTPRWGRPSSIAAAQQAVRRSARPRWLPPWFPFVVVLLAAAAVLVATIDGQSGSRAAVVNPAPAVAEQERATPTASPRPTGEVARSAGEGFVVATPSPPTATPHPSPLPVVEGKPTPIFVPLPTAQPSIANPLDLPAQVSPSGPIVAAYTTYETYVVQPGDTLNRVATNFGVSGDVIIRTSGLHDPNLLVPGQVLSIPRDSGWLYRVQPGDTLDLIAVRFGLSTDDLVAASSMTSGTVRPGELLFIPNRVIAGKP